MPVKAESALSDTAKLDDDIRTGRHGRNAPAPCGQYFGVTVGGRAHPHQATDMIQDDSKIGHRPGKRYQLSQLGMVQRILQAQPPARQYPGACPVIVASKPALDVPVHQLWAGIPSDRMTDTTKAVGAGRLHRV